MIGNSVSTHSPVAFQPRPSIDSASRLPRRIWGPRDGSRGSRGTDLMSSSGLVETKRGWGFLGRLQALHQERPRLDSHPPERFQKPQTTAGSFCEIGVSTSFAPIALWDPGFPFPMVCRHRYQFPRVTGCPSHWFVGLSPISLSRDRLLQCSPLYHAISLGPIV